MLTDLGERLADRDHLGGGVRGFSDIAIFPFVRQFAGVDAAWFAEHAPLRVCEWLDGLVASPLFGQAMVKIARWGDMPH